MLSRVEHIALAVADLEQAIKLYTGVWGLTLMHREVVEDQAVEEAMFQIGESYIQLLAPLNEESTVAKFIDKRGEGLHHIAYEVQDLQAALNMLADSGVKLIDREPRRGSRGTMVAFVHPKSNLGVLVELVQLP